MDRIQGVQVPLSRRTGTPGVLGDHPLVTDNPVPDPQVHRDNYFCSHCVVLVRSSDRTRG